jgi:hypothetical protein
VPCFGADAILIDGSDAPGTRKVGGNGPILGGMEAQIVDGEMWFRGPNIMLGLAEMSFSFMP